MNLAELMAPDWAAAMQPMARRIASMGDFLREENAAGRGYLPAGRDVFAAFAYALADVRVLVVGQDPYPTPGPPDRTVVRRGPDGASPAGQPGQHLQGAGVRPRGALPSTGDPRPWAEHGVMLLNRVLTVQPGRPAAHRGKGWEAVTGYAIDALVARGTPAVAILWGRDAQSLQARATSGGVQCLTSPHPSPLSASRGFFGSRPFSRANDLLAAAARSRWIGGCRSDRRRRPRGAGRRAAARSRPGRRRGGGTSVAAMPVDPHWWRSAVIYQIYPRSFADSNGDGWAISAASSHKMPYLASLGVDALWLSPVFASPAGGSRLRHQ